MTEQPNTAPKACPFCGCDMEERNGLLVHPDGVTRDDACVLSGIGFPVIHTLWGTNEIERWNRRADLAPKVKPLEWVDYPINGDPVVSMAVTPLGTYFICDDTDDFSGLYCEFVTHKDATWYGTVNVDREAITQYQHIDDHSPIQKLAQADYERRILSALTVAPITPAQAAKVLLVGTTVAEKKAMNEAGIKAFMPSGWELSDKISFDHARIAALKAIAEEGE